MAKAYDFNHLWERYQESRKIAHDINPDGNRCAMVLGLTLKSVFKPRKEKDELSFREISQPPKGIRGQPFLDHFYVKAEQLANRISEEWGPPEYKLTGIHAFNKLYGLTGIIFIENAWETRFGGKIVDHIDLWNGSRTGAYDTEHCKEIFNRADWVSLWLIHSPPIKT